MKKLVFISSMILFGCANAQFIDAVNFGSPNSRNDFLVDSKIDENLNYYVAGTYATDSIDGNSVSQALPNFQGPINAFFIAKYSSNGQFQYIKTIIGEDQNGTSGTPISNGAIEVNSSGELYFACQYSDKVNIDGQSLTTQYDAFGETSICIGKLDASGNLIWLKNAETLSAQVGDLLLKGDSLYLGGLFEQQIHFDNNISSFIGGGDNEGFLVAIDESTGTTMSIEVIQNGYIDYLQSTTNGLIASGTFGDYGQNPDDVLFSNGVTLSPQWSSNQNNRSNGFFISYDDQKNINYIKHIEGNTDHQDFTIVDDKIWFTANNFDYFKMDGDSIPGQKHLLIQLELSDGSFISYKECSRYLGRIVSDPTNDKIFTLIKGSNNVVYDNVLLASNPKLGILVTDESGTLIDSLFRGGYSTNYSETIFAYDNKLVFGGGLTSSPSFSDSIVLGNGFYLDGDDGLYKNGWYAFYNVEGGSSSSFVNHLNGTTFNPYPNPFIDFISFDKDVNYAEITDLNGKKLLDCFNCNQIETNLLPSGLYFLKISTNSEVFVKKMIKN